STTSQQHRSIRETFTSRVKDVMYSVFKATGHKLPSINTQASPSKIQEWKSKAE
ncbi:6566_t:CDS:1, partial [Rhizophagus irregularis]